MSDEIDRVGDDIRGEGMGESLEELLMGAKFQGYNESGEEIERVLEMGRGEWGER